MICWYELGRYCGKGASELGLSQSRITSRRCTRSSSTQHGYGCSALYFGRKIKPAGGFGGAVGGLLGEIVRDAGGAAFLFGIYREMQRARSFSMSAKTAGKKPALRCVWRCDYWENRHKFFIITIW